MAPQHDDMPAEGYGAASGSLSDPACKLGTKEFKAAKEENNRVLGVYRSFKKGHERSGTSKPDMKAASNVREAEGDRSGVYGHIPGVAVSDAFEGRGELAVLGLHTQMMKGINNRKDCMFGAMAICMSGRYRDNEDMGETFVYTGAGGQDKGNKQVKDQSYDHADNAALLNNFKTGTPVRVFRAGPGTEVHVNPYTYEGLYKVIAHKMEDSSDGPKVIRFTLQGVPGHFAVSGKVEFKALQRAKAFQKIQLAGAGAEAKQKPRKVPKNYKFDYTVPTKAAIRQGVKERAASGEHGVLVTDDISEGLEKVPIPVWNSLDDQHNPFVPTQLGHKPVDDDDDLEFEYLAEYVFTKSDAAAQLARQADKLFKQQCGITCGIQFHGGECPYNEDKLLQFTQTCGLMECPKNCRGGDKGKASLCRRNRVVAEGIKYPLEVFKVAGKGWGARCAVDLPTGSVLCRYIGVVITDEAAEEQAGADTYLYDLDHFHLREEAAAGEEEEDPDRNPRLPPIPDTLKNHHLTVDASHEGNVARFFNHSCDPNCVTQPVFTMDARSQLLHYIVIVAAEDIPKFTELTYDYGSAYIVEGDPEQTAAAEAAVVAAGGAAANARRIPCNCGAYNCRGWLKDC